MLSGGAASAKDMPAISHAAGETLAPQQLDFLFQPVELDALSVAARQRALDWLQKLSFSDADRGYMHVDAEGGVYFADAFPSLPLQEALPQAALLP
ncbi:hypothetical protein, partial [Thiolapillus sp.]